MGCSEVQHMVVEEMEIQKLLASRTRSGHFPARNS